MFCGTSDNNSSEFNTMNSTGDNFDAISMPLSSLIAIIQPSYIFHKISLSYLTTFFVLVKIIQCPMSLQLVELLFEKRTVLSLIYI